VRGDERASDERLRAYSSYPNRHRRSQRFVRAVTFRSVPYVQAQVGHEDATTTLKIYAQVLKRRDRTSHGQAFDALMANAFPSAASIIMHVKPSTSASGTLARRRPFPADLATETGRPTIL
jgi:hypothetical protein